MKKKTKLLASSVLQFQSKPHLEEQVCWGTRQRSDWCNVDGGNDARSWLAQPWQKRLWSTLWNQIICHRDGKWRWLASFQTRTNPRGAHCKNFLSKSTGTEVKIEPTFSHPSFVGDLFPTSTCCIVHLILIGFFGSKFVCTKAYSAIVSTLEALWVYFQSIWADRNWVEGLGTPWTLKWFWEILSEMSEKILSIISYQIS